MAKKNVFTETVNKHINKDNDLEVKMMKLSKFLIKLTGLNPNQMENMTKNRTTICLQDYIFAAESFCWNGWENMLVVRDKNNLIPENWEHRNQGTGSAWVPPDDELEKIINIVRENT